MEESGKRFWRQKRLLHITLKLCCCPITIKNLRNFFELVSLHIARHNYMVRVNRPFKKERKKVIYIPGAFRQGLALQQAVSDGWHHLQAEQGPALAVAASGTDRLVS
jgi:hypothetical protein